VNFRPLDLDRPSFFDNLKTVKAQALGPKFETALSGDLRAPSAMLGVFTVHDRTGSLDY